MKIRENVSLAELTTMRLGDAARYVVEIANEDELVEAVKFARAENLPWFVLGGGSNVIANGDFDGVIILNRIQGFKKLSEDENSAVYRIGAGEIWDSVVEKLCRENLSGVECMSAIPGVAGATPVQNVGAFGQEIADTLTELGAFDTDKNEFVTLDRDDCGFSYRNSRFKNPATRHHIITSVTLRLRKTPLAPPFYPALEKYLSEHEIIDYSPMNLRRAVIEIRADKLPDPREIPSAGSFFKNPIVAKSVAQKLLTDFPDAPHWEMPENRVKLAAGWLIDHANLKGFSKFGFQIYPKNALVITNVVNLTEKNSGESEKKSENNSGDSHENLQNSVENLAKFRTAIVEKVRKKFGVTLEQEPENL